MGHVPDDEQVPLECYAEFEPPVVRSSPLGELIEATQNYLKVADGQFYSAALIAGFPKNTKPSRGEFLPESHYTEERYGYKWVNPIASEHHASVALAEQLKSLGLNAHAESTRHGTCVHIDFQQESLKDMPSITQKLKEATAAFHKPLLDTPLPVEKPASKIYVPHNGREQIEGQAPNFWWQKD